MIYLFLAPGFEEIEAIAAADVLRRAELDLQLVGVGGKTITGAHGIAVNCDIIQEEADPQKAAVIVLPGGQPGTLNLERSGIVQEFISLADTNGLLLCAICAAPSILGHRGLLEGKRATCFPGYEQELGGADYTGKAVEMDGKIITAKGPGAAVDFGLKIVEYLLGRERAEVLRASMQCGNAEI